MNDDDDDTRRLHYLLDHAKTCPFAEGGKAGYLYERLDAARKQFEEFSKDPSRGNEQYYNGMASGLSFALQEIDRPRYEREATSPSEAGAKA